MSRMAPERLAEFLGEPHVGVIASLRADGRPYTVPVWWRFDGSVGADGADGVFWLTGTTNRVWCRQIMADDRVSLCIETTEPAAAHIGVDGRAQVLTSNQVDIWPESTLLADKYVGRGDPSKRTAVEAFVANMRTEPRLLIRIVPEVWRAIDLTVYRGKRADRQHQDAQGGT
ncbi:MAG: hypothetical protein GY929_04140 [Actinomycetia bacterium]|nr:hypothetical protein [Actinomycetes bacterium]